MANKPIFKEGVVPGNPHLAEGTDEAAALTSLSGIAIVINGCSKNQKTQMKYQKVDGFSDLFG
jgi:hypothetical protein